MLKNNSEKLRSILKKHNKYSIALEIDICRFIIDRDIEQHENKIVLDKKKK